jgi:hypothetical protein
MQELTTAMCRSAKIGPDHEWYWEAWISIIDNAVIESNGVRWRLHQEGDLWEVPEGYEWPED